MCRVVHPTAEAPLWAQWREAEGRLAPEILRSKMKRVAATKHMRDERSED